MKKTIFSIVATAAALAVGAQNKEVTIQVAQVMSGRGEFECAFRWRGQMPPEDAFIIFVAKPSQADDRLEVICWRDNKPGQTIAKFQRLQNTANLRVRAEPALQPGVIVFPVVVRGDGTRLDQCLGLVHREFRRIEDVLNVLNKSGLQPVGFTEFVAQKR